MSASDFVHLHVHTDYSLLDGACRIDRLMDRAATLGMTSLALTDHGSMFGTIEFYNEAKKRGIKPLVGCEIYLAANSRLEKTGRAEDGKNYYHMGLLARNITGYQNLLKLVSDAHLNGFYYKPRADFETLAKYADGLIGFSGCLAAVIPQHLMRDRYDEARAATARFIDIFGHDNFFIEIQDHGIEEQIRIIPDLLKLAEEFKLKVVCTNDVHYINHEDAAPHDALLCIQTGSKLIDQNRMRFDGTQFYLKTRDEMMRIFGERPDSLTNTLEVAEMCDLAIPFPKGSERYPRYPLPPEIKDTTTPAQYLHQLCTEGLKNRYQLDHDATARQAAAVAELEKLRNIPEGQKPQPPDYSKLTRDEELVVRTAYELAIINVTGFVDYFLVVWDFIHWAKQHGIPVGPGRGSGAGCLVAYLLGITNLDPLRFGLLFERFLNPERVSPPDFDIDFCMRRRGEVIDYVREKYGKDCVANIITYGTLGAKMAIRDIARVNSLTFAESDRIAKMIPDDIGISLADSIIKSAELRDAIAREPQTKKIIETAKVVEGMVRNTGKHAAGIIITDQPLDNFVPLTLQEGDVTVQFDMAAVGKLGLLKMDFLGLKTLTIIADAVENVRRTADKNFDIETIPLDDPKTYQLLNAGKTVGVFQLESAGMQNAARQVGISTIDDINAISALYRPGPMQFIPDYARGKKDPAAITYPHPLLEPVLKETYGIIVYQEQVMECARVIAGYSLGGADMLRRAMGKKDAAEMDRQRGIFVEGAKNTHNIDPRKANEIFDLLNKFAQYGFNKSHSAAYAIIAYQTAYLKANYPVQFMAATLTAELGNAEKVSHFIGETEAMGITVLGPDINESREAFTPVVPNTATPPANPPPDNAPPNENASSTPPADAQRPVPQIAKSADGEAAVGASLDDALPNTPDNPPPNASDTPGKIRFGLAGIKGVGEGASQKIIAEREAHGPYADFTDFLLRSDTRAINKRVVENLVATGAFDYAKTERETLYPQIDANLNALAELHRMHPGLRQTPAEKKTEDEDPTALLFDLGETESLPPPPPIDQLRTDLQNILRHTKTAPAATTTATHDDHTLDFGTLEEPPPATAANGQAAAATTTATERTFTAATRLQFEKELLGFYISGHPLDTYGPLLETLDTCAPEQLLQLGDRMEFRLCGLVTNIAKRFTKKESKNPNAPWASFKFSTKTASLELNMFPEAYKNYGHLLAENAQVAVLGNIIKGKEGDYRANIKECYPLASYVTANIRRLAWILDPAHPQVPDFLEQLRNTIDSAAGDIRIDIGFRFDDEAVLIAETSSALAWKFNPASCRQLRKHPAVVALQATPKPLELKEDERWRRRK